MSVELGIAPNDLLDAPIDVFAAMGEYLEERRRKIEKEVKKNG